MDHWYLIHSKVRQEQVALDNLERQGYACVLPMMCVEKLRRGRLQAVQEVLFPRYLFVRLGSGLDAQSWGPIRSTVGVSRMITFGQTPARVSDDLIDELRRRSASTEVQRRVFEPGEPVMVTQGPFAGLDAVYQMTDAQGRVMVLLDILSKQVKLTVTPTEVRKAN